MGADRSALTRPSIEHTLNTTRFIADLQSSIRERSDLAFLSFADLLARYAPERTHKAAIPDRWRTRVSWRGYTGEEGIRPDRIFALMAHGSPAPDTFFLENDEGTETIAPSSRRQAPATFFRQNSILRKFVLYAATFRNRTHTERFGIPSFRVLFVTTTPTRAENMIEAFERFIHPEPIGAPAGLFLFTDRLTLAEHRNDPLALPWLNGVGKPCASFPNPFPRS